MTDGLRVGDLVLAFQFDDDIRLIREVRQGYQFAELEVGIACAEVHDHRLFRYVLFGTLHEFVEEGVQVLLELVRGIGLFQ